VATVTYFLVHRISRDRLAAVGLTLAAIGASFTLWSARPLFLGILAFLGLLWIVEVPDSWLGQRAIWTIPVLVWLWANTHGTFSLGLAYLGLHLAGRWLEGAPFWAGRERVPGHGGGDRRGCGGGEPLRSGLLLFPVQLLTRGDILKRVSEWRSPDFRTIQGLMFAGWLAVFVACFALGRRRPSRRDVVVTVPFLLLAFWAQRNIALSPLVGVAAAARCVGRDEYRPPADSPLNRIVAVALIGLGLVWTAQAAGEPDFDTSTYPVAALHWVADHGLLGRRLMTTDAWAGYVILRWWPEQKVFVDDRYDMYPRPILEDFIRFDDGDRRWPEILDRNRIDVVVWRANDAIVRLMEANRGWTEGYRDKKAVVLTRAKAAPDPPAAQPTEPAAPPKGTSGPAGLGEAIDRFAAEQPVPFSVVARLLPDGPVVARSADRRVPSASLYKLFVARELLRRVGAGSVERAAPAVPTADGRPRTAGDCIRDMIVLSDNPCGVWGLGQVGGRAARRHAGPGRVPGYVAGQPPADHRRRRRPVPRAGPGRDALRPGRGGGHRRALRAPRGPAGRRPAAPGAAPRHLPRPGEGRAFGAIAELARRAWAAVG